MNLKEKKIVFIDLDGTLINTKSGAKFPKGIWDMELNFKVLDQLKKMSPSAILIVTNQGGLQLGIVNEVLFQHKFLYVISCMQEYIVGNESFTYIAGKLCKDNNEACEHRKPNTGMLKDFLSEFSEKIFKGIDKKECIMIGDASGLKESFSDSDLKTAINFGIDYMDVHEFEKFKIEERTYNIYDKDFNIVLSDISEEEKKKFFEDKSEEEKDNFSYAPYRWIAPDIQKMREIEEENKKASNKNKKNNMKVVK